MSDTAKRMVEQAGDPGLILTPMINEWMMEHHDNFTPEAIAKVREAYDKPPRKRAGSFSASSAGTCLRRQELTFLGKPQIKPLPATQEIFSIGTALHQMWQTRLLSANLIEEIEVPLFWPRMLSKGSADGQGYVWWETTDPKYQGRQFLLELKTHGQWTWDKTMDNGISDTHLAQMHRYMLVSGIDLCVYLMVDKGNHSKAGWHEIVVEADPELLDQSRQELDKLVKAAQTKTLHPILSQCKMSAGPFKGCPFGGTKSGVCFTTERWE